MRTSRVFPLLLLCVLSTGRSLSNAQVNSPVNGSYQSVDIGGPVFTGRVSESWGTADPGYGDTGNTLIVTSLNGPAMGTQWEFWCATISAPPVLFTDSRDSTGTGKIVWQVEYTGGHFWLAGDGPWGTAGCLDFNGTVESMTATSNYWYYQGSVDSVYSTFTLTGRFDPEFWNGSCIECAISGVAIVGTTDDEPKPIDYPPLMASNCQPATSGRGAWGDASGIEIHVHDCAPTPVKNATWGEIKALYGH